MGAAPEDDSNPAACAKWATATDSVDVWSWRCKLPGGFLVEVTVVGGCRNTWCKDKVTPSALV